jgi:hypothetical protein
MKSTLCVSISVGEIGDACVAGAPRTGGSAVAGNPGAVNRVTFHAHRPLQSPGHVPMPASTPANIQGGEAI